ncbi:MAG: hypothetical protein ACRD3J_07400 [Thermoanaerobaculia bacterium]
MFLVTLGLLAVTAASPVLPSVAVQTLSGERVVLPRDLTQLSIFVAGFSKSSRAETEPWARRLREDSRVSAKVRIYEVSILDGVPGFLRGMILSQMKSGVAAGRRKQFLIVTESIDAWKRALDSSGSDDHAYVILVRQDGAVIWRGHGAITDSSYHSLLDAIKR